MMMVRAERGLYDVATVIEPWLCSSTLFLALSLRSHYQCKVLVKYFVFLIFPGYDF